MKILSIAKKQIMQTLRNLNVMLIMTLMPIILILLLGLTFGSAMEENVMSVDDMKIEYAVSGETGDLTDGFLQLMDDVLTGKNNTVSLVTDETLAKNNLKDGITHSFIAIDEENPSMTVYKNAKSVTESALIEGVLGTYVGRYNAIYEIIDINPAAMMDIDVAGGAKPYTKLKALGDRLTFGGMDYYGVSMVVLFGMYGILVPFFAIFEERKKRTGDRMLLAPITKAEFFLGKLLGTLGSNVIQIGIVILVTSQVFGVNWGPNPGLMMLLILAEVILAISIGITMGLLIPIEGIAMSVTHTLIALMAFFGGAYMPLAELGELGAAGKFFSPVWWVITGIINHIYLGDSTVLWQAFAVCLGAAGILLTVSVIKLKRVEGLYHA